MKRREIIASLIIAGIKIGGSIGEQIMIAGMSPTSATFYQISNLMTNIIPNYMGIVNALFSDVLNRIAILDDLMHSIENTTSLATEKREEILKELGQLLAENSAAHASLEKIETLTTLQEQLSTQIEIIQLSSPQKISLEQIRADIQSEMGKVYQANMYISLIFSLLTYPLLASTSVLMQQPFAARFNFTTEDLTQLQQGINMNYLIMPLMSIYNTDTVLFCQNKNVASFMAIILANYAIGLPAIYLTIHYTNLGFSGIMLAGALAYATAVVTAKLIQAGVIPKNLQTYFPSMRHYHLFDLSFRGRLKYIFDSVKRGYSYFTAELSLNFTTAFIGLNPQFNSVSLNGGLAVMQNASSSISQQATSIASPYIAESETRSRKKAIFYQILIGMAVPSIIAFCSLPFARPLSLALGGESTRMLSNEVLISNGATVMGSSFVFGILQMVFQTLISMGKTVSPGLILTCAIPAALPVAFLLQAFLPSSQEQAVGNYSLMIGTLLCMLCLWAYIAKLRTATARREPTNRVMEMGSPASFHHPANQDELHTSLLGEEADEIITTPPTLRR